MMCVIPCQKPQGPGYSRPKAIVVCTLTNLPKALEFQQAGAINKRSTPPWCGTSQVSIYGNIYEDISRPCLIRAHLIRAYQQQIPVPKLRNRLSLQTPKIITPGSGRSRTSNPDKLGTNSGSELYNGPAGTIQLDRAVQHSTQRKAGPVPSSRELWSPRSSGPPDPLVGIPQRTLGGPEPRQLHELLQTACPRYPPQQ
jgi:hypothetical protein